MMSNDLRACILNSNLLQYMPIGFITACIFDLCITKYDSHI